jgi:hypothetical protein
VVCNDLAPALAAEVVKLAVEHRAHGLHVRQLFNDSLAVVYGRTELGPALGAVVQPFGLDLDVWLRPGARGPKASLGLSRKADDRVLAFPAPPALRFAPLLVCREPAPELFDLPLQLLSPPLGLFQLEPKLLVLGPQPLVLTQDLAGRAVHSAHTNT